MSEEWDISKEDVIAVSFYATDDCTGGAFREQLIIKIPKSGWTSKRVLNRCDRKARELKARSYKMWVCIPRSWKVWYEEDD